MIEIKNLSKEHFLYVKGIAILIIIIAHIGNYSGKTWFTPLGGIGVAIFLFCSGYGLMISYHKNGLKNFWKKKFVSIYLPYVFVEIVATVFCKYSASGLLKDLFFLQPLNPLGWYLQYLLFCYILFYFITKTIDCVKYRFVIWSFLAILSFVLCQNLQAEQAISFLSGLLIAELRYNDSLHYNGNIVLLGILLIGLSLGLLAVKQVHMIREANHYLITLLNLLLKSGAAAGILCITSEWMLLKNVISWFGRLSYSLYLIHGYFLWIVRDAVMHNFGIDSIIMILCSLFCSLILNELILFLKKWKERMYDSQSISN